MGWGGPNGYWPGAGGYAGGCSVPCGFRRSSRGSCRRQGRTRPIEKVVGIERNHAQIRMHNVNAGFLAHCARQSRAGP
ncbi:MAG: hypothetical protein V9E86_07910 [Nitrosomonas sp.]